VVIKLKSTIRGEMIDNKYYLLKGRYIMLIPKFDICIVNEEKEEAEKVFEEIPYDKISDRIYNILCERSERLRGAGEVTIKLFKV